MSLSAAPHVARQGRQSVTETVVMATGPGARCSQPYAPTVVKIPKCRSNPAKVDRYIVASATARIERADNDNLTLKDIHRLGIPGLYMSLKCVGELCH